MNIIVCLDDRDGMLFMKRRQSRDSALCSRVLQLTQGKNLWMNAYSAGLFAGADVIVDEAFLEKAGQGDYCFVENADVTPYLDRIEKVLIYRWNRHYPADTRFPATRVLGQRSLRETTEFSGSSHEKITEEVYEL